MMELKGWHRRFLGNSSSAVWNVDRRMGKDSIVLLDVVKYMKPFVVVPNSSIQRKLQSKAALYYSFFKSNLLTVIPADQFGLADLESCSRFGDALYFLEWHQYSSEAKTNILSSLVDTTYEHSLLRIVAKGMVPVQVIGSGPDAELRHVADMMNAPYNRVLKDY